jgi:hypothetical protein
MMNIERFKLIDFVLFCMLGGSAMASLLTGTPDDYDFKIVFVICLGFMFLGNAVKYSNLLIYALSVKKNSRLNDRRSKNKSLKND